MEDKVKTCNVHIESTFVNEMVFSKLWFHIDML